VDFRALARRAARDPGVRTGERRIGMVESTSKGMRRPREKPL
jgi:hypothetical protein